MLTVIISAQLKQASLLKQKSHWKMIYKSVIKIQLLVSPSYIEITVNEKLIQHKPTNWGPKWHHVKLVWRHNHAVVSVKRTKSWFRISIYLEFIRPLTSSDIPMSKSVLCQAPDLRTYRNIISYWTIYKRYPILQARNGN